MNSNKQAQGGSLRITALGLLFALTVNAAFGFGLSRASTSGQRIYDAWNNSSDTMMAERQFPVVSYQLPAKATRPI